MTDASTAQLSDSTTKSDSVIDLLTSVEKIKMSKSEKPISFLFNQVEPRNLKERLLYSTFEIIAEKGADALTASELIRKTESSKGALFHHFETIDHLCVESLLYFKKHLSQVKHDDGCQTLEEYLKYLMTNNLSKQSTRYYVHLVNFFRDRAIRDERYREPLKGIIEVSLNFYTDRILSFLPPETNRQEVFDKVVFMSMTIERVGFYRVLYQDPEACQDELNQFLERMIQSFKSLN